MVTSSSFWSAMMSCGSVERGDPIRTLEKKARLGPGFEIQLSELGRLARINPRGPWRVCWGGLGSLESCSAQECPVVCHPGKRGRRAAIRANREVGRLELPQSSVDRRPIGGEHFQPARSAFVIANPGRANTKRDVISRSCVPRACATSRPLGLVKSSMQSHTSPEDGLAGSLVESWILSHLRDFDTDWGKAWLIQSPTRDPWRVVVL